METLLPTRNTESADRQSGDLFLYPEQVVGRVTLDLIDNLDEIKAVSRGAKQEVEQVIGQWEAFWGKTYGKVVEIYGLQVDGIMPKKAREGIAEIDALLEQTGLYQDAVATIRANARDVIYELWPIFSQQYYMGDALYGVELGPFGFEYVCRYDQATGSRVLFDCEAAVDGTAQRNAELTDYIGLLQDVMSCPGVALPAP